MFREETNLKYFCHHNRSYHKHSFATNDTKLRRLMDSTSPTFRMLRDEYNIDKICFNNWFNNYLGKNILKYLGMVIGCFDSEH